MHGDKVVGNEKHAISLTLVEIVKKILRNVMDSSEQAVMQIGEKIQGMSSLTEDQKRNIRDAFEGIYQSEDEDELKKMLNDYATRIADATANGDLEEVERLSSDPKYKEASKTTKRLHDAMQQFLHGSDGTNEYIMPALITLQFHDRMRQDVEALIKSFDRYFEYFQTSYPGETAFAEPARDFWIEIAHFFTSIEARERVLKTALGSNFDVQEKDVRALLEGH